MAHIPTFGRDIPAILASDDSDTIVRKVHDFLASYKEALDVNLEEAKESGEADSDTFCPGGHASIVVAYEPGHGERVLPNLNYALQVAINGLQEYGLHLVDADEWRRIDLTDENDENSFGYTIGALYRIRIGDARYGDRYNRQAGEEWDSGHEKFLNGDLPRGGNGGGGGDVAALLAQVLGSRH